MNKKLYFAILAVAALFFACRPEVIEVIELSKPEDVDGNVYDTVRVGTQTWISQDLKVKHSPNGYALQEFRPGLEEPSYLTYGGKTLYNAMAAQYGASSGNGHVRGLCPEGWHLPSRDEWQVLSDYVTTHPELWSTSGTVSRALASQQWPSAENPTALNQTGFSAMPTGYLISYPRHTEILDYEENINRRWVERGSTYYWSATHNEHYPLTPPAPNDSIVIPGTPEWGDWIGNDSFQVHSYIFLLNINQENPRISSLPDIHYCAIRCMKD